MNGGFAREEDSCSVFGQICDASDDGFERHSRLLWRRRRQDAVIREDNAGEIDAREQERDDHAADARGFVEVVAFGNGERGQEDKKSKEGRGETRPARG